MVADPRIRTCRWIGTGYPFAGFEIFSSYLELDPISNGYFFAAIVIHKIKIFVTIVHFCVHSPLWAEGSSPNVIWNSWSVSNLSGHVPTSTNQQQADILHTARVMTSPIRKFLRSENKICSIRYTVRSAHKIIFSSSSKYFLNSVVLLTHYNWAKTQNDLTKGSILVNILKSDTSVPSFSAATFSCTLLCIFVQFSSFG